ncbi:MAG: hypothetical protein B7733_06775 [Myxococcales bacterium FL481]|nr:MAG: hypothetical protein B7733_06775 [Myxococcales bacterium FL481]
MSASVPSRSPLPPSVWPYVGFALSLVASFVAVLGQQAGLMPTLIVGGSMLGGLVCWLLTTARIPAEPRRVLPIYAATVTLLMVHILEEYVTGFGPRIGQIIGSGWSEPQFVVMIGLVVPLFWIGSGTLVYLRNPLGNWILWFIWFGMILGEPVHLLVFPFLEEGHYSYFPGMWTALLPLVTAVWGMSVLVTDYRLRRSAGSREA